MCMDFGERVRRAVLDSGLKQNELADRIGITPAARAFLRLPFVGNINGGVFFN